MNDFHYKLIVSDFDGTLADSSGKVPQINADAIRAFLAAGGIFTVSTGRMYRSIVKQLRSIGLSGADLPLVSFQGALISDAETGRVLHSVTMNRESVRKVLRFCKARGLYCHFYSFDRFYTEKADGYSRIYAGYTDTRECLTAVGDLEAFMDAHPEIPICKVLIIHEEKEIAAVERAVNEYLSGELVFKRSAPTLTECVDPAAGKGAALKRLCAHYGVPIERTLAVGDSANDESMLRAAGLGVAMGNADAYLKSLAGYVTESNDEGGLARVIRKVMEGGFMNE